MQKGKLGPSRDRKGVITHIRGLGFRGHGFLVDLLYRVG